MTQNHIAEDQTKASHKKNTSNFFRFAFSEGTTTRFEDVIQERKVSRFAMLSTLFSILVHRYIGQNRLILCIRQPNGRLFTELDLDFSADSIVQKILLQFSSKTENLAPTLKKRIALIVQHDSLEYIFPSRFLQPILRIPDDPLSEYSRSGLSLFCNPNTPELLFKLKYNSSIFNQEMILQIADHFKNLAAEMLASPTKRISELQMMGQEELNRTLHEWNGIALDYEERCVHESFEEQAAKTPHSTALICGEQKITYEELNSQSNKLAHHLRRLGVRPEAVIGVGIERSVQAIVAILAILKTGAAYCILNPEYPAERLQEMSAISNISTIIANSEFQTHFNRDEPQIINLDGLSSTLQSNSSGNLASGAQLENAAYVTFTSGSTGKPKGVIGIHRSIACLVGSSRLHYSQGKREVCCLNAPLSFGSSVATLFMPLCSGLPLVIVPNGEEKDPRKFADIIYRNGITSLTMVPALLKQLFGLGADARKLLRSVVWVGLSGSAINRDTIKFFRRIMPKAKLAVAYASSEIGSAAFGRFVNFNESRKMGPIPLGRPGANARIYILDKYLNPVPAGVPGELYIAADHLGRGYIGQADLTAERFLPNPFAAIPGKRFFRTGDIVRFRSDGEVEYLGRSDNQVKIRGFRVELGEIETALADYSGIDEAVVINDEYKQSQRLAAYVVKKKDTDLDIKALRTYLQRHLPQYMIPSVFFFLEDFPLNANGKIDRNALQAVKMDRPASTGQFEPPRNLVEATLLEIWQMVLGINQIGIHDEFLDIGGESMVASHLIFHIRERFSVEIPLSLLFSNATIASLAEEIVCLQNEQIGKANPPA